MTLSFFIVRSYKCGYKVLVQLLYIGLVYIKEGVALEITRCLQQEEGVRL